MSKLCQCENDIFVQTQQPSIFMHDNEIQRIIVLTHIASQTCIFNPHITPYIFINMTVPYLNNHRTMQVYYMSGFSAIKIKTTWLGYLYKAMLVQRMMLNHVFVRQNFEQ